MLTILIEAPEATRTILVEVPADDIIRYRLCAYCGEKLVRAPRKTCCNSHRTLLSLVNSECQTKD